MAFEEEDNLLLHLLSFHKKSRSTSNVSHHSEIESGTISRTQAGSDRHRVNIRPIEPVAMSEKHGDHVAEYTF